MKIKYVVLALISLNLWGCATPKHNYMPVTTLISEPPLGSVNTTNVGDTMLRQGKYVEQDAILLESIAKTGFSYTLHPGYYIKHGEDQSNEYYLPGGDRPGRIEKNPIADNWSSVALGKADSKLCIVTIFNVKNCTDGSNFKRVKKPTLTEDSFQQTLIYSGKVGNKINIGYREFSSSIARPAFNNNVEYDLSESKTIGYKGAELEILDATNQNIKFKVIKNFNKAEY
jgi:hypothetical protein